MADWWTNYPWRLIQTNLREIDMRDIRADQVVRDLVSFKATLLMINAAGIIASYPTKLPYHFQSPYLSGDSLLQIIEACHAADIRVIARTDFSKVRRPIYEQHPEWAYQSASGKIVDYNGDVHVCVNSWYQQQGILAILDELFSTHPFDGVFFNMGGYITHDYSGNFHGPCCCRNCQLRFLEMFSQPLPVKDLSSSPSSMGGQEGGWLRLYAEFKRRTLRLQEETIYTFLKEHYLHLCIANHLMFGRGFIRQEANTALDRPLPVWQYSASENTKWAVSSYPDMVSSSTTVDFIDFPYRHTAVSPHEQSLRLAQSLANGGALDYYLIGRLDNHADRSGFVPGRDLFHYHAAHTEAYTGLRSRSDIALLKPMETSREEYRGWYRTLVEAHFFFDVFTQEAALDQSWERYRALILPGMEAVSDALVKALDEFVSRGGIVIASGRTGWKDESGVLRSKPALQCLGIAEVLAERRDMRSSYFQALDKTIFPHLEQTDLVFLDGAYYYARYHPEARSYLQLIPPHKFGPPERCYYEQVTGFPGLVGHEYGSGKALYLPWQPGTQFYRYGHLNTFWFLADVLEQLAGLQPLGGNLPAQVEATWFENAAGEQLIHLVNTSGHFGNSYHAPIPINDIQLAIPWSGDLPRSVIALRIEQDVPFTCQGGVLNLHLPRLEQFEAIKITSQNKRI